MKKFLAIGAALAALTLPALADVQVRGILINQAAPKAEAIQNLHPSRRSSE